VFVWVWFGDVFWLVGGVVLVVCGDFVDVGCGCVGVVWCGGGVGVCECWFFVCCYLVFGCVCV